MKKILFCLVVTLGLIGCDFRDDNPGVYRTQFIYFNECSTEVSVKTFSYKNPSEIAFDRTYTIPVGDYHTLTYMLDLPIIEYWTYWGNGWGYNIFLTEISNGEKTVTIPDSAVMGIYDSNNYLVYSDESDTVTWIYAFTDDFFADGEPIEPSEP